MRHTQAMATWHAVINGYYIMVVTEVRIFFFKIIFFSCVFVDTGVRFNYSLVIH